MKAILVRSKVTRQVLVGAIFVGRDEVIPFMNPLIHYNFKIGDFKHYLNPLLTRLSLEEFKCNYSYEGDTYFQEVISNG
ncbi:hypothetical protein KPS64_gp129 [Shigella phage KPS64]|uniref:Uncharacterized protein n=4 Tax=Mooglevirus TaxID=1985303 RepID=A0A291AY47_9CAUD|nr:hypothetical protein FDI44_gp088 [Shigella phage Sf13]ATE85861.1 hypothetical protein Sf13_gp61 [Shigella phage Sf13]ATE85946.1 hypothetical protein Sf15_gp13 [Shigella phage Sf15]ATE86342.1 hypothetical protein Sf18_gp68 [Shigella phage Sf18]QBP32891.1 hypothetical protein KPS64_gp129 [Shigella phage KPS64]